MGDRIVKGLRIAQLGDEDDEFVSRFVFERYREAFKAHEWNGDFEQLRGDDVRFRELTHIFIAEAPSGELLGSIRLIFRGSGTLLPIERDFKVEPALLQSALRLPGEVAEVARFATSKVARSGSFIPNAASYSLIREVVLDALASGVSVLLASLDVAVLEWLTRASINFRRLGEPEMYLGSPTAPVYLPVRDLVNELKIGNKSLYDMIFREM